MLTRLGKGGAKREEGWNTWAPQTHSFQIRFLESRRWSRRIPGPPDSGEPRFHTNVTNPPTFSDCPITVRHMYQTAYFRTDQSASMPASARFANAPPSINTPLSSSSTSTSNHNKQSGGRRRSSGESSRSRRPGHGGSDNGEMGHCGARRCRSRPQPPHGEAGGRQAPPRPLPPPRRRRSPLQPLRRRRRRARGTPPSEPINPNDAFESA